MFLTRLASEDGPLEGAMISIMDHQRPLLTLLLIRVRDYCLRPNEQFVSYIMEGTSYIQ